MLKAVVDSGGYTPRNYTHIAIYIASTNFYKSGAVLGGFLDSQKPPPVQIFFVNCP